jgi:hypothetical protein
MRSLVLLALLAASLSSRIVLASDHIDGPVTTKHRVGDLTDLYAFPTPDKAGHLTVILDAYPIVPTTGHFSEKVTYRIHVGKASVKTAGKGPRVEAGDRVTFDFTFETPHDTANHAVVCRASNGWSARSKYEQVTASDGAKDLRVFAGMRSDPFFFNAVWAGTASKAGRLLPPVNTDSMKHMNVLSIVMDVNIAKLFPGDPGLLAIVAETTTQDSPTSPVRRLDRVGRPELTNVSMVAHAEDPEVRDRFNQEDPFHVSTEGLEVYRARLAKNIGFYDAIDRTKEWQDADRDALAGLLADDFLLVDPGKPNGGATFFEIEKGILQKQPHTHCGGRHPQDDIMDTLFTLYIAGLEGKRIRDGVDEPSQGVSSLFPYLAKPDLSLVASAAAAAFRKALGLDDK